MPDLNKMLIDIRKSNENLEGLIKETFKKYEQLYYVANSQYVREITASGSSRGLEDFYLMVQTIKRNRDVIGSLIRGTANLRSLKDFKIIEEDRDTAIKKPRRKKQVSVPSEVKEIETVVREGLNA